MLATDLDRTAHATTTVPGSAETTLRPPAVPLIAVDPYFSVWSFSDVLTDQWTRHWTDATHALAGLVRIDGVCWRFMGPRAGQAMEQVSLEVMPTRTRYRFRAAGVELCLTFATPALPDDLDLFSWPLAYVDIAVTPTDGRTHEVALYVSVCGQLAVDSNGQHLTWSRYRFGAVESVAIGSQDQQLLRRCGDNVRIDWGWCHLVCPPQPGSRLGFAVQDDAIDDFAAGRPFSEVDDVSFPRPGTDGWPKVYAAFATTTVGAGAPCERRLVVAYDDVKSIEYFHRRLPAYWRRDGKGFAQLLIEAVARHDEILARCAAFDEELTRDLHAAGGQGYAKLCALSYRQCTAAHKLVADIDGTPLYFSKENFSNGCIATVDVTYPSAPFFLLLNPALLEAQLVPILAYAASPRWKFPFAPHDLGCYPHANGQVYGGGERSEKDQMPVEECGNMLLLVAALTKAVGNTRLAEAYWPQLTLWARYLREQGYDPGLQLCTDDFAGHLAHNTNLSLKAILALAAYARLCAQRGLETEAAEWRQLAIDQSRHWLAEAADGDHYKLTFDKPGTWSQKYNLVWDRLLDLHLFPESVAKLEVAHYRRVQGIYGVPLDSRRDYTKLDWIVWSATLTGDRADFDALVDPVVRWANETTARVPLTDWYSTVSGKQEGFQARSVVGGLYIKLLDDAAVWRKWSRIPAQAHAQARAAGASA
jgi:hypothetical protein